jgi:pilus assembly protein CpaF
MLEIDLHFDDGARRTVRAAPPVTLGRAAHCDIRIRHWRVGREHARLTLVGQDIMLDDLGTLAGTLVNGKRIAQYGPLTAADEVLIGPCLIQAHCAIAQADDEPPVQADAHDAGDRSSDCSGDRQSRRDGDAETVSSLRTACGSGQAASTSTSPSIGARPDLAWEGAASMLPHRRRLHAALLDALDLRRRDVAKMSDTLLRNEAQRLLAAIVQADTQLPQDADKDRLLRDVLDEAVGLGPLSPLLEDPGISEIMVNRYDEIYVERAGQLLRHGGAFSSEQAVLGVIERIVAPIGRRIDESTPMVDARLADGSRVNAVVSPVALKGASLTIRKFPSHALDMDDLVRVGSLDDAMAQFLGICVRERVNIVVSGGTGSGKTTLLNILSNAIPDGERIVTIEDAAELRLRHAHLVGLEARPANIEGRGRVEIRDLVRNALRMRPDRIVVGECRGAEAFDMLAAMNTGHEGSLTTLHANSPRDALARLETMILMAGMDLPLAAAREHIASSIHLIVQQSRLSDGRRAVTSIVEITGMESGRTQTQEIFRFERAGAGAFLGCSVMPILAERWREQGRPLAPEIFNRRTPRPAAAEFGPAAP